MQPPVASAAADAPTPPAAAAPGAAPPSPPPPSTQATASTMAAVPAEPIVRPSSFVWPASRQLLRQIGNLPLGFLWTPAAPMAEASPVLYRTCVRCAECGGVVHPYTTVILREGQWLCTFCGHQNRHVAEFADPTVENYPELALKAVEYVEPDQQPSAAFTIGASNTGAALILIVDENMSRSDATNLQASIQILLADLPRNTTISLITYSNTVTVYNLFARDVITGTSFSGQKELSLTNRRWIQNNLVNVSVQLEYSAETVASHLKVAGNFRECTRAGSSTRPSALSVALQVAHTIVQAQNPDVGPLRRRKELDSHIVVFTASPPQLEFSSTSTAYLSSPANKTQLESVLVSAKAFYRKIGSQLLAHDVAVDVFNIGHAQLGLSVLAQLTQPSAGRIFTYSDCNDQLTADLVHIIWEERSADCVLSVRCPTRVSMDHVVGPSIESASRAALTALDFHKDSAEYFRISNLGPTETLAVYMQLRDGINADFEDLGSSSSTVTVQTELLYTNRKNERTLRVCTFQLRLSNDRDTVLAALDGDVTSVMLARLAVTQARTQKGTDGLDTMVSSIARSAGYPQTTIPFFKLPLSLQELPMRMYHLRRGPLMGSVLQHPDDIALAQTAFLSMPLEASLRQIMPMFLMLAPNMEDPSVVLSLQLPLVNMALRSDRVLLLDDQTSLMVWFGRETTVPIYEPLRQYALQFAVSLAQGRFPRPTIRVLQEGSSMARFLLCRLAPLHKETRSSQEQQLPELAALTPAEYQRLLSNFYRTDEPSYGEFCRILQQKPLPRS